MNETNETEAANETNEAPVGATSENPNPSPDAQGVNGEAPPAPEPEIHTGTLLDGTEIEYVVDVDGVMSCVSPASVAGMALTRRNDATKNTPGSLKLVGKPRK